MVSSAMLNRPTTASALFVFRFVYCLMLAYAAFYRADFFVSSPDTALFRGTIVGPFVWAKWGLVAALVLTALGYRARTFAALSLLLYLNLFGPTSVALQPFDDNIVIFNLLVLSIFPVERPVSGDVTMPSWPLGLFQANLALVYFSAFAAKLTQSGLAWANGEILRAYLIERYFQTGSAITQFVAGLPKLCMFLSSSMLLFEGLFWLVLVSRRARLIFAPLGIGIHIAVYFIMGINFMKVYMLGYLAFIPFERLLRAQPSGVRLPQARMNTARPLWPAAVLGVFVLIQGYADIFRINHWPLSDYPMFAYPRKLEDASGFRLRAEKANGEALDIPVLGGAATMFIYNEHIESGNFASLRPQMVSDARDHFRAKGSWGEITELAKLHLLKMRAVQTAAHGFQIEATTVYSFDAAEALRASSDSFK